MPEEIFSQPESLTTPIPQVAPPIVSAPPKSNVLPIILTILLTFTSTAAAFFAYLYFQKPTVTPLVPLSSPTPIVEAVDPTTNQAPNGDLATWKTYTIQQLNLSFKVPESIEFTTTPVTTTSHKNIFWNDIPERKLIIGATSPKTTFEGASMYLSGGIGYKKTGSRYQFLMGNDTAIDIPLGLAEEKTTSNGLDYLLVQGDDAAVREQTMPGPGTAEPGTIGAIIHTGNKDYPAVTVQMKLSSENTVELFQQILETVQLSEAKK